jgi:DNA-binding PadR family transcriptional regulator
MSLAHAVLTSLIEKSSSGYDLARRFDKSIGYFWHASHQQIYRELARMETAGWIASSVPPDAGKTRKREYRVLPEGRAELARWASEPSPAMDLRDELMVKLRADAALDEVDLRDELRRHIALHQDKLAQYHAIEQRDFANVKATGAFST